MARAAKLAALPPVLPSHRIERFFARHLIHGKGHYAGRPFTLSEPWEIELVQGVYDPMVTIERGSLLVREVREGMLGIAKKNGKTHIGAGLGLYGLTADGYWRRDAGAWIWQPEIGAEIFNVAGGRDQAGVLFELGVRMVERSPLLRSMCRIYKDAIECPERESVWRVLASDARLAHGWNPTTALIDEIWTHRNGDLYEAFASAGAARPQPLVLTITTAGFDRRSIARKLYERGQRSRSRRFWFRWYEGAEGCDLDDRKAWRDANPSRWVSAGYLAEELKRARELGRESEFRRWHLNQWSGGAEAAFPLAVWSKGSRRPSIRAGDETVIAVDSAPKRDSTAVELLKLDAAGDVHVKAWILEVDPDLGHLDFERLKSLLRDLATTYDVRRIGVDPYNLMSVLADLEAEGLPIVDVPQGDANMVRASGLLHELLVSGKLRHGNAPELTQHALAAGKKETERGWRLKKLASADTHIDGATALAIGVLMLLAPDEDDEPAPMLYV